MNAAVVEVDAYRRPEDGDDWGPAVQRAIDANPSGSIRLPIGTYSFTADLRTTGLSWGTATVGWVGGPDEHRVPQIGDDELQAWVDFISETKQRASRIMQR